MVCIEINYHDKRYNNENIIIVQSLTTYLLSTGTEGNRADTWRTVEDFLRTGVQYVDTCNHVVNATAAANMAIA